MKAFLFALTLGLSGSLIAENQETPPAQPPADPAPATPPAPKVPAQPAAPVRRPPRWQDAQWLGQMDRLRSHPRAGDIQTGTISANVVDVFEMDDQTREKAKKIMDEYDIAITEQARRWNKEAEGLRAEFEQRLTEVIPEARRDTAKKVLDFSHRNWSSSFEKEEQFKKEYAEQSAAMDKELAKIGNDEDKRKELRQRLSGWVAQHRKAMSDPDRDAIKQLREMMSPEEAARMDQYDRARPIQAPQAGDPSNPNGPLGPRADRPVRPRERKNPPAPAQSGPQTPAPAENKAPAPEQK